MNTWFISDEHFFHKNIIRLCNRPFSSVEEMNEKILENINSVVKKGDILYHLGDFALGNKEKISSILERINCKTNYLILGNHDSYSPSTYMDLGFSFASKFPIIIQNFIILTHRKSFLNGNCQPYVQFHGHVHDNEPFFNPDCYWNINLSVENINYTPKHLDELTGLFIHNYD